MDIPATLTAVASVIAAAAALKNHRKIEQVHILVNGRIGTMAARIEQLTETIESVNGLEVPPEPAEPKTETV